MGSSRSLSTNCAGARPNDIRLGVLCIFVVEFLLAIKKGPRENAAPFGSLRDTGVSEVDPQTEAELSLVDAFTGIGVIVNASDGHEV
jgi:hypothetical protein